MMGRTRRPSSAHRPSYPPLTTPPPVPHSPPLLLPLLWSSPSTSPPLLAPTRSPQTGFSSSFPPSARQVLTLHAYRRAGGARQAAPLSKTTQSFTRLPPQATGAPNSGFTLHLPPSAPLLLLHPLGLQPWTSPFLRAASAASLRMRPLA
eukprot:7116578-Prorocentrum_lima.AAC.1